MRAIAVWLVGRVAAAAKGDAGHFERFSARGHSERDFTGYEQGSVRGNVDSGAVGGARVISGADFRGRSTGSRGLDGRLIRATSVVTKVLERTGGGGRVSTPVCYAESDYLVSGWTLGGDEHLAGQTAAAQVEVGSGSVVLFAFAPHFRGQPRNTFKLLFNALVGSATEGLPPSPGLDCS